MFGGVGSNCIINLVVGNVSVMSSLVASDCEACDILCVYCNSHWGLELRQSWLMASSALILEDTWLKVWHSMYTSGSALILSLSGMWMNAIVAGLDSPVHLKDIPTIVFKVIWVRLCHVIDCEMKSHTGHKVFRIFTVCKKCPRKVYGSN